MPNSIQQLQWNRTDTIIITVSTPIHCTLNVKCNVLHKRNYTSKNANPTIFRCTVFSCCFRAFCGLALPVSPVRNSTLFCFKRIVFGRICTQKSDNLYDVTLWIHFIKLVCALCVLMHILLLSCSMAHFWKSNFGWGCNRYNEMMKHTKSIKSSTPTKV